MAPDLLTPAQVAERLGKSADYWLRRARRREVPHRRIGRTVSFSEADVEAILSAAQVEALDPMRTSVSPRRRSA